MSTKPNTLTPREAIIDAVLRYTQGLDDRDATLISSAITDNMVLDLRGINEGLGFEFEPLNGKENVTNGGLELLRGLETMHQVTNFRVEIKGDDGERADLNCYALAQHFRRGEGTDVKKNDCFLVGSRYRVDLVREEDGVWRIEWMGIKPVWTFGDMAVMSKGE